MGRSRGDSALRNPIRPSFHGFPRRRLHTTCVGFTLSLPIADRHTLKLSAATTARQEKGPDFDAVTLSTLCWSSTDTLTCQNPICIPVAMSTHREKQESVALFVSDTARRVDSIQCKWARESLSLLHLRGGQSAFEFDPRV